MSANDTVVVSNQRPVHIPLQAFDADGRETPLTGARYEWVSGDSLSVSADGVVTCTRNADGTVRATYLALTTQVLLRCRPVQHLKVVGPMQLVVGDSSQRIPVQAIGLDNEPVDMFAGSVSTRVDSIVDIEPGLRLRARRPGGSLTTVYVGDVHVRVGVHTYDRVHSLDSLASKKQRAVMLPLQLSGGEVRRVKLPPGIWMLTMLPYEDEFSGLQLKVEGGRCIKEEITPRRMSCASTSSTYLVFSNPTAAASRATTGELLLDLSPDPVSVRNP